MFEIHLSDCLEVMRDMVKQGKRVDAIITDPPYLYLKHKLDRPFDERSFFELASKLTNKIIFFGRGDSFYRWNLLCEEFEFVFKEEIIWNKRATTSPINVVGRCHETISIRAKKGYGLNKVYIDPIAQHIRGGEVDVLINDLKRAISSIKNSDAIKNYLEKGERILKASQSKHGITSKLERHNERGINTVQKYIKGMGLKSILYEQREHYSMAHPTQKPPSLLRKLVLLISDKGDTIFDPFSGSGSTGIACMLEGRKFIGCEIDKEYHSIAKRRLEETDKTLRQSLFFEEY